MNTWTTTSHLGEVSMRLNDVELTNLRFRIRCTDPLQTVDIDYVALYLDGYYQTETLSIDNPYTFGFNTQMKNNLISGEGNHYTAMYALNGFSGTVNCKITDLSGAGVRDILVNRTFNSSNPITFGTPPSFTLTETGEYYIEFQATHNSAFALVPGNPHLAATFISIIQMARTVTLTARDQTLAYRYGFNGKMNLNDLAGLGMMQDYGFRTSLSGRGRFMSVDPLREKYPELTPYQFASNTPIQAIDLDGLEAATMETILRIGGINENSATTYTTTASTISGNIRQVSNNIVEGLTKIGKEISKLFPDQVEGTIQFGKHTPGINTHDLYGPRPPEQKITNIDQSGPLFPVSPGAIFSGPTKQIIADRLNSLRDGVNNGVDATNSGKETQTLRKVDESTVPHDGCFTCEGRKERKEKTNTADHLGKINLENEKEK